MHDCNYGQIYGQISMGRINPQEKNLTWACEGQIYGQISMEKGLKSDQIELPWWSDFNILEVAAMRYKLLGWSSA